MNNPTEDTISLIASGLTPPRRAMHFWIGIGAGFAILFWIVGIIGIVLVGDAPHSHMKPVVSGLLAAAITSSVIATVIGVVTAHWRAVVRDHEALRRGQREVRGELASMKTELIRITAKLDANESTYWRAYSDVASDLLGKR